MAEKPPAWTPSDGTIGQVPIAITYDIDPAGVPSGQDPNALAADSIRNQQPMINRFVKIQRQQIELAGKTVHNAVLPLQGLDIHYRYVQPFERMHYYIYPQLEIPTPSEEVPEPEAPTIPTVPEPPEPPELEQPTVPEAEVPAPPTVPEEQPEEEQPEEEQPEEEEQEFGKPDFLEIDVPFGLAVQFGAGGGDPL